MRLQFHSLIFPLCLSCYLAEFVPRLFHKSGMELIFSNGKQSLETDIAKSKLLYKEYKLTLFL